MFVFFIKVAYVFCNMACIRVLIGDLISIISNNHLELTHSSLLLKLMLIYYKKNNSIFFLKNDAKF